MCLAGIPEITGKCPVVHKEHLQHYVPRLHQVGSCTGRKGDLLLSGIFLAPSLVLLVTKGYTQLLIKLSLLHCFVFPKFSLFTHHVCAYHLGDLTVYTPVSMPNRLLSAQAALWEWLHCWLGLSAPLLCPLTCPRHLRPSAVWRPGERESLLYFVSNLYTTILKYNFY